VRLGAFHQTTHPPQAPSPQLTVLADSAVEVNVAGAQQACFELPDQDAALAAGGSASVASSVREAIPGAGEGEEVGAPAAAVGGEHRADAAVFVGVGADDDPLGVANALKHGGAGGERQAVDRQAQRLDVSSG
jgi:hypothetical protein